MYYDNTTIPVECAECSMIVDGLEQMIQHIVEVHPDYKPNEAINHAKLWMQASYEKLEKEEREYNEDRKNEYRND